jgi:hypothetical protein
MASWQQQQQHYSWPQQDCAWQQQQQHSGVGSLSCRGVAAAFASWLQQQQQRQQQRWQCVLSSAQAGSRQ